MATLSQSTQASSGPSRKLHIESLADGVPVIQKETVAFYKHNCMVCFDNQGHKSGVMLEVEYKETIHTFEVCWQGEVTEELKRSYRDLVQATNHAACTIALLLVRELTEFTTIEQAAIGTTVDYYLAPKDQDETLIFNHSARLEVSGILAENQSNTVQSRVKSKIRRLKGSLPTFIVVVEFSKPWSRIVKL